MTNATAQVDAAPTSIPMGNPASCRNGRQEMHVLIDFSVGAQFTLDLSQIQASGTFDSVQSVYVDNSNGTDDFTMIMGVSQQNVTIPKGAQGYIPVAQPNPPVITCSVASGTPKINLFLFNFFVPPCVWYTAGMPVNDLSIDAVTQNGAINTNVQPRTLTGGQDHSGTITTGGTRQALLTLSTTRKKWILSNPDTATETLYFSYLTNTAGLIPLPPGTTWIEADFSVVGDPVFVVAATSAHAFTAYEW